MSQSLSPSRVLYPSTLTESVWSMIKTPKIITAPIITPSIKNANPFSSIYYILQLHWT